MYHKTFRDESGTEHTQGHFDPLYKPPQVTTGASLFDCLINHYTHAIMRHHITCPSERCRRRSRLECGRVRIRPTNGFERGEAQHNELRRRDEMSGTILSSCQLKEIKSCSCSLQSRESELKVNPDEVVQFDLNDVVQKATSCLCGDHLLISGVDTTSLYSLK